MIKESSVKYVAKVVFRIVLVLVLLEVGLRVGGWVHWQVQESRNRISLGDNESYRVLALGDSFTYGVEDSWPQQLEEILNERSKSTKFRVFNKARVGESSSETLLSTLEEDLDKYNPHMVIVMIGIADEDDSAVYQSKFVANIASSVRGMRVVKLISFILDGLKSSLSRSMISVRAEEINLDEYSWNHSESEKESEEKYLELARYHTKEGKYDHALLEFSRIVTLAWKYQLNNRSEESMMLLDKSLAIDPDNPYLLIKIGKMYQDLNQSEKAVPFFEKAISSYKRRGEILGIYEYVDLEEYCLSHNRILEAEKVLERALTIERKDSFTLIKFGWMYEDLNKSEKAAHFFEKALDLDTKHGEISSVNTYAQLVWLYMKKNEHRNVENVLNRINRINPAAVIDLLNIIVVYFEEEGMLEEAQQMATKVKGLRNRLYNPVTERNYQKIYDIVTKRGVRMVAVQYPSLGIDSLEQMLSGNEGVIFVSNEENFEEALKKVERDDLFKDRGFGIGHCTPKGNKLIAENVAGVILEELDIK